MQGKRKPRHQGIGDRLRQERDRRDLSLRELATVSQVSKSTLTMIENGHNAASMAIIEALSDALGVSAAWLAFGLGPRDPVPLHFRRKAGQFAAQLDALPEPWGKEAATMLRAAYGLSPEDTDD